MGTRNRVIDGCSRGGGRRLCKEDVGWIVDLNNVAFIRQTKNTDDEETDN